jgi:sugar phosphate isomerase/epimerase
MRFAFSTVSCPKWDFDTIVARAKEYGYEGVEVRGFLNESILTASNPFLTDPRKLRDLFNDNDLDICCLASSIAMSQNKKRDAAAATDLRQFIDTAAALGCPLGEGVRYAGAPGPGPAQRRRGAGELDPAAG